MKIISILIALTLIMSGCKSLPTEDRMYSVAEKIGIAAGYAVELNNTENDVKTAVINVFDSLSKIIPETNQTFGVVWKPIIDNNINKLVIDNKLKSENVLIVKNILYVTCDGIDLVFIRYPKAKQYKNLIYVAVDGFTIGFKNTINSTKSIRAEYDKQAYDILSKKLKNK
jgi:hypothetical protein